MCYFAVKARHKKCVANSDIVCYKVLEQALGFWMSPYFGLHIDFNKILNHVNVNPYNSGPDVVIITEGYHSYNSIYFD